jgi:hypothetical protein
MIEIIRPLGGDAADFASLTFLRLAKHLAPLTGGRSGAGARDAGGCRARSRNMFARQSRLHRQFHPLASHQRAWPHLFGGCPDDIQRGVIASQIVVKQHHAPHPGGIRQP